MNRRRRTTVGLIAALVLVFLAIGLVRTAGMRSHQVAPAYPAPVVLDAAAAAERLAALIRVPTVSWGDASKRDAGAFDRIVQLLDDSFPRVHAQLTREVIARWSLLYEWRGQRLDLPPIILTSHLDVVPADPATVAQWTHAPFDGAIADGSVWGRGAIDDKSGVAGLLEAADALLASGFAPTRTVYFAFGHNEEGGGDPSGAAALAAALAARGVSNAWLMDEGGLIYDQVQGVRQPVAFVGVAEKAVMTLEIAAGAAGGHAGMPPAESAIGILARALDRLEQSPMPARLDGAAQAMFLTLAPDMTFPMRAAFANLGIARPLVLRMLSAKPQTNALIRTTTALTMLEGSPKANVLATRARAVASIRLLPGDTPESVESHVRRVVNDERITLTALELPTQASRVSAANTPEFATLSSAIRAVYPNVLVAPYLTVAATDAREYRAVASQTYRFLPVYQDGALESIHGINEHIRIDAYERAIRVYATLMRELAGPR
jgi:carboxypeptidase PM20D1